MIIQWDKTLFTLIHNQWSHPLLDQIMPVITDLHQATWFNSFVFPLILALWIFRSRTKALKHILGLLLVVGSTDIISHRLIKQSVERERPRHHQNLQVNLKTHPHAGWSFTSNHAANNFAAATYLRAAYPFLWPSYIIATLIAYSRIYVGVHFPLDVLGGALLGTIWTFLLVFVFRKLKRQLGSSSKNSP